MLDTCWQCIKLNDNYWHLLRADVCWHCIKLNDNYWHLLRADNCWQCIKMNDNYRHLLPIRIRFEVEQTDDNSKISTAVQCNMMQNEWHEFTSVVGVIILDYFNSHKPLQINVLSERIYITKQPAESTRNGSFFEITKSTVSTFMPYTHKSTCVCKVS
jgi:hypothetical protein